MTTSGDTIGLSLEFNSRLIISFDEHEAAPHSNGLSHCDGVFPKTKLKSAARRENIHAKDEQMSLEGLLSRDFRSPLARYIEESRCAIANGSCDITLEVPETSLGHIIGKSHRNINALREFPGVSRVVPFRCIDEEDKQLLHISGTEEGVAKVSAQIKRLQLRSLAGPNKPGMHVICFGLGLNGNSHVDDPILLRMVSCEQIAFFGANHLRSFSDQNFTDDMEEKTFVYYYFHSRSSGEAAAISTICPYLVFPEETKLSKRQKMLERLRTSELHGSWDKTAVENLVNGFLKKAALPSDSSGHHMKVVVDIGKTFFRDVCSSVGLWKVSVQRLDSSILQQKITPLFCEYCSSASISRARQFMTAAGYQQVPSRYRISSRLVDRESNSRESFFE